MFGEEDHNEYENFPKKFKSPEGNYALSAEILEQVFLYLNHEDLMTLLTVCKFWAAVAERPQLWTEFRLVISKHNSSKKIISHLLSLHRFAQLRAITVTTSSPAVSEAIYKHPGLVELYCSEVGRPRKGPGQEQHLALLAPALDRESNPQSCSKVEAVRIRNCFMLCGQLSTLLSAICEGQSSVTSLALTKLGSGCINAHTDCPLSAGLLGQATGKLTKLCLDSLGWTCNLTTDKLEALFQGIKEDTALKELILSKVHIAPVNSEVLAQSLTRVEKVTLSEANLSLEQAKAIFTAIKHGGKAISQLSIYQMANNDCYNMVRRVDGQLLAEGMSLLERVSLENVHLDSRQVTALLDHGLQHGSRLKELRLDRFDADRSHIFLPASLLDNLPFDFHFNH